MPKRNLLYLNCLIYRKYHHLKNYNNFIYNYLLPITIKSLASVNLKEIICGVLNKTFGFPPNSGSFASISPNALDTFILN